MYYVYLLKSLKFDQTYIGSTKDLRKRFKDHNLGKSISTKRYLPWKLVYYEAFERENLARVREKSLKYNGNAVRELKKRVLSKSGAGYTLIEVLVGLTIIGFLFGLGYVNFRDFSRRQGVSGAAKKIQGDLALAQQLALSGQKPNDVKCTASGALLNSYDFRIIPPSEYVIEAKCTGGIVNSRDVVLPDDISIASGSLNTISFKVLGQGTNIPAGGSVVFTLTQTRTNNKFDITIGSGGNIQ